MAQVNTQPVLFIASGLLSAQNGPSNVGFPVNAATNRPKRWRIQAVKVLKIGAPGAVQIFDSLDNAPSPAQEVFSSDITETPTNLGINILTGDIYVKITGGYKVWLYLDLNS